MNFENLINELMKEYATENCYKFWIAINNKFPTVWNRLSSSTKKYHKRSNGEVPSIAEHTYEMLYSASKLIRMFNIQKNTKECDTLFLSISFHDFFKYGIIPNEKEHTDRKHDQISADVILKNKETFLKFLDNENFHILEESVRFHSGRWSTDLNHYKSEEEKDEFLSGIHPIAYFVHVLDMMSTNDLIKI